MNSTQHTSRPAEKRSVPDSAPATAALTASQLSIELGGRTIINSIDLQIPTGKVTAIIGPNGCGKSTLLKSLCRILKPSHGTISIGTVDISSLSRKRLSQQVSLMAQSAQVPEGITVRELVGRGRFPYQSWASQWSQDDEEAVNRALAQASLEQLADARVENLSGGQRQRAWLAMILAQNAEIMLLDEPTTYLDIGHQHGLLKLVSSLRDEGQTIVAVLHDLQQAIHYADHLIVMKDGRILATGAPTEIITAELVQEIFDLDAEVVRAGKTEQVVVLPR